MKGENHHIDKLFEESLGSLKVEPRGDSWAQVANGIDKFNSVGNRRRVLIRWIGFGAALIAITTYLFVKSCSVNGLPNQYQVLERIQIKQNLSISSASNSTKILNHESTSNSITTNNKIAKVNNIQRIKHSNVENNKIISQTETHIAQPLSNLTNSYQTGQNNAFVNEQIDQPTGAASKLIFENNISFSTNEKDNTPQRNDIEPNTDEMPLIGFNNNLATDSVDIDSLVANINAVNMPLPSPKIATSWNFEFGFGPTAISNNLPENIPHDKPIVQTNLQNVYPSGELFLHLKYNISDFYIKSGIQFSEFGNPVKFDITTTLHDTSGGYLSWNFDRYYSYDTIGYYEEPNSTGILFPILQPTLHIDTISSQWNSRDEIYYAKTQVNAINRYQYFEIPLILGYQKHINRVTIYSGVGIGYGIMINTTGKFIVGDQLISTTTIENPYNKFNFNYMLNLGAGFAMTNQWNIFAQTSYKSNLTPIYKPQFDNNTRFNSIGLQLGISYNIKY